MKKGTLSVGEEAMKMEERKTKKEQKERRKEEEIEIKRL